MDIIGYARQRANLRSTMLGVGTVLAGTAGAAARGNMEVVCALVCLLFVIMVQVWANFYHTSWVMKRQGFDEPRPKIDDGDKRVDPVKQRVITEATGASFIISLMLGLAIMWMAGSLTWPVLIGLLVYGLNVWLNQGVHPRYGTFWSVVITFLLFGPIGVMGTTMMQIAHDSKTDLFTAYDLAPSFYMSLAMGVLAVSLHLCYSYMNYRINPKINPNSVTVKMGPKVTDFVIFLCGFLALAIIVFMTFYLNFREPVITILPGVLAFAFNSYIALRLSHSSVSEIKFLCTICYVNYLLTGLLQLILSIAFGYPDDSLTSIF